MSITLDNKRTKLFFGDNYLDGTFTGSNFITQAYLGNNKILDFETVNITHDNWNNYLRHYNSDIDFNDYILLESGGSIHIDYPVKSFTITHPVLTDLHDTTTLGVNLYHNNGSIYVYTIAMGGYSDNNLMYYTFTTPVGNFTEYRNISVSWDITPYNFTFGSERKLTVQYGKDLFGNLSPSYDKNNFYGYTISITNSGPGEITFKIKDLVIQT